VQAVSASLTEMELVLGHGASGTAVSMRPHVTGLRERGIDARAIDLPKRKAEQAVAAYLAASGEGPQVAIGGHSYGGRVASLLAAGIDGTPHTFGGLVLLSYPLHRPGGPEWEPRTRHWEDIHCPVIFLSGEADAFAKIDLLRVAIATRLPQATLVTYPRLGHGLLPVLPDALDRIAAWWRELEMSQPS
jgi:predicted alpha/beta-hydrolase family hydrolase